ncbi:MAG: molybdenum cofactor sulfurase [Candidatus Aminicenantes bacterium RBG_13_64_14]|nr:MAG: molybdenum cofactor sulfurase [Candidatus Aminicenantes bacterium RBG_13_64_14]
MKASAAAGAGTIVSVNASRKKGQVKTPVPSAELVAGQGIKDDAHRGFAHRQVSLLMIEDIEEQRSRLAAGSSVPLGPGAFAENLTTRGIDLGALSIGDELVVGDAIRMRVSQIGKECHTKCAVFHLAGDCIMPVRGIFCEVLAGGTVRAGDVIEKQ